MARAHGPRTARAVVNEESPACGHERERCEVVAGVLAACTPLASALDETGLAYTPRYREYGLAVDDGGSSRLVIGFCPFCGTELPASLRDAWFERMERLGLDPAVDRVPDVLADDRWWHVDAEEAR